MNPSEITTLLVFLGKGAAVLSGGLLAAWCWRKSAAPWLSTLWRATFIALLALTPWLFLSSPWAIPLPGWLAAVPAAETPLAGGLISTSTEAAPRPLPTAVASPAPARPFPWAALAWSVYGLGVAACLASWLTGRLIVRRWARTGQAPANPDWAGELARLSSKSGPQITLAVHDQVASPAVTGWRRPVLLLPPSADALPREAIQAILRHELCHLQRGDLVFQFLAMLGRALHWPNPLAWLAARQLALAAERTADDAVLASGHCAHGYGRLLASLAAPMPSWKTQPLSAMARPCSLETRLRHALDPAQRRQAPSHARRLAATALALALAAVTGTLSAQKPAVSPPTSPENAAVEKKLNEIIIPMFVIEQVDLSTGLKFLQSLAKQHDNAETDPAKKGVRFELAKNNGPSSATKDSVTLDLKNIPLKVALKTLCDQANTSYRLENGRVRVAPVGSSNQGLLLNDPVGDAKSMDAVRQKLKLVLPTLALEKATLEETVEFLRIKSRELDVSETDASRKGLNFILRLPASPTSPMPTATLQRRNITYTDALDEICRLTGMTWKIVPHAILIAPPEPATPKKAGP